MLAQLNRQDRRRHDNPAAYRPEHDLQGGAAAPVVNVSQKGPRCSHS